MVDNLTFDDGEPITNTKLQSLYTAIKKLEGDVAKTTIVNTTDNTKYTPIIYAAKVTDTLPAVGTSKKIPITFTGFQTSNIYVTATIQGLGLPKTGSINYSIVDLSSTGANIYVIHNDSTLAGKSAAFHYIAVEMKLSS